MKLTIRIYFKKRLKSPNIKLLFKAALSPDNDIIEDTILNCNSELALV
jgi:hypothetical protein